MSVGPWRTAISILIAPLFWAQALPPPRTSSVVSECGNQSNVLLFEDFTTPNYNRSIWNAGTFDNTPKRVVLIPEHALTFNGSFHLQCNNPLCKDLHRVCRRVYLDGTGNFDFLYGQVEFRMTLPPPGSPSMDVRLGHHQCTVRRCPDELTRPRIYMFVSGRRPLIYFGIHYYDAQGLPITDQQSIKLTEEFSTQFRTFRLNWTPDELRWFVNSVTVASFTNPRIIPKERMSFSVVLGCYHNPMSSNVAKIPPFGATIDYIRITQPDCHTSLNLSSINNSSTTSVPLNGKHTLSSRIILHDDFNQEVQANASWLMGTRCQEGICSVQTNHPQNNGSLILQCDREYCTSKKLHCEYTYLQVMEEHAFVVGKISFRAILPPPGNASAETTFRLTTVDCSAVSSYVCDKDVNMPSAWMVLDDTLPTLIVFRLQFLGTNGSLNYEQRLIKRHENYSSFYHNFTLLWMEHEISWLIDQTVVASFDNRDKRLLKTPPRNMTLSIVVTCPDEVMQLHNEGKHGSPAKLLLDAVTIHEFVDPEVRREPVKHGSSTTTIIYASCFGGLGGSILLTAVAVFCMSRREKSMKENQRAVRQFEATEYQCALTAKQALSTRTSAESLLERWSVGDDEDLRKYLLHNMVAVEQVKDTGKVLGKGKCGVVTRGTVTGLSNTANQTAVAIKKRLPNGDTSSTVLDEITIMVKTGQHLNIVNLLGVLATDLPVLLLEYCEYGCLEYYLKEHRHLFINQVDNQGSLNRMDTRMEHTCDTPGSKDALNTRDLLNFTYQMARGTEHLASRNIVHRDLAARNMLVAAGKIVKISDFGMAKEGAGYFTEGEIQAGLPVRWMALESLVTSHQKTYNTKTDIWSFGIVMWETFSLSAVPYTAEDVLHTCVQPFIQWLSAGSRLQRPLFAPSSVYEVMASCWADDPDKRPTFSHLRCQLDQFISADSLDHYLRMEEPYQQGDETPAELQDQVEDIGRSREPEIDNTTPASD